MFANKSIKRIVLSMKRILLFIIIISHLFVSDINSQNLLNQKKINNERMLLVMGGLTVTLAGSYYYAKNTWWTGESGKFHFDNGPDFTYALNVDKAGHFIGGLQSSDMLSSALKWSGMKERQALWYGAMYGTGLQFAIEMKDGYATYWGFSKWDLILGSSGSFWPIAQEYLHFCRAFDFKLSYWKRSNIYWELEAQRGKYPSKFAWHEDYPNQTYWLSADINRFLKQDWWPDYIYVAFGFGLNDKQYLDKESRKIGGRNEFYIALDYNIPKLLSRYNTPLANSIKHWMNYIKLPSPTIQISPSFEFYPFFL